MTRNRLSLEDWVRQSWLPTMETRVKLSTLGSYRQMMEDHVLPPLGSRHLQELGTLELDSLYVELLRGDRSRRPLGLNTVANIHRALHKALADAVDAGMVVDNAASRAKPPRPWRFRSQTVSTWLPSELAGFLNAVADDRLAAAWRLAAMTGMRRGEVLGLRWCDVDLERRRLSVRRALVDVNYRVVESTPKGSAARTVGIDWRTVKELSNHQQSQRDEIRDWGDAYEHNDLVVVWQNGSPIHPQAFSRMFREHVEKAGLRRIRLHDLRHTHATMALHVGVPVTIISERLGHHSPGFTLRQYAHTLPGMQAPAAALVAEMIHERPPAVRDFPRPMHQHPGGARRSVEHGSDYHRHISLFLSSVEETTASPHRSSEYEHP